MLVSAGGPVPARPGRNAERCSLADAELAVDAMAALHAGWWNSPRLQTIPWLDVSTILPGSALHTEFGSAWPLFLQKVSVPITKAMRDFADRVLSDPESLAAALFDSPPITLIHHDFQADNLMFQPTSNSRPIVIIDWQMAVCGRGPVDLAYFLSGNLGSQDRREHEGRLISRYATKVAELGVADYDADSCLEDYRTALFLPPARLAVAVARSPQFTPHPGAFWDVLFQRQICALADHHDLAR